MKIIVDSNFCINGRNLNPKEEIYLDSNARGKIKISAKGTDQKITFVVKGKINGKEIEGKAHKKIGKPKEIKIKKFPSELKSEVKNAIKRTVNYWKKLVEFMAK